MSKREAKQRMDDAERDVREAWDALQSARGTEAEDEAQETYDAMVRAMESAKSDFRAAGC